MKKSEKREVGFERVIFFSDAVVAIAITLLALELKLHVPANHHITFHDLLAPWKSYLAFVLSFINIAGFWRTHHYMFTHIHRLDERLMTLNTFWLFFIITLPFATSLVGTHFGDTPSIFLYSMNILLLSAVQNFIWDYSVIKKGFIHEEEIGEEENRRMRIMFNLDMINGLIAVGLSFFYPKLSFILLFFKVPLFLIAMFYIAYLRRKEGPPIRKGRGRAKHTKALETTEAPEEEVEESQN